MQRKQTPIERIPTNKEQNNLFENSFQIKTLYETKENADKNRHTYDNVKYLSFTCCLFYVYEYNMIFNIFDLNFINKIKLIILCLYIKTWNSV